MEVIFNNILTQPGFKLVFFLFLSVQHLLKDVWLYQYCLRVLIEPSATGTKTSRKWLWRKTELSCCVSHPHMVSATSRIWCRSSRGGSLLTTLWKLWPVRQVRWKLFSVSEMTLIQHCLTLLMATRRLSEWWWPTEGLTWSEPKGASPESGGDLQGGAPPAARREQQRGWAVPVVAPQRRRGESQGAAAHPVPHCGEDDKRAHDEVVTDLSVAVGDQQTGYCCIFLHWTIEPSKYRRLSLLTEVFTCANNIFWLFMVRISFRLLMFFNWTANAVRLPVMRRNDKSK